MEILIRQEQPSDHETVVNITELAFKTMPYADGDEQELVRNLRHSEDFIPALSLVAEIEGKVIGHIMFTTSRIIRNDAIFQTLTLAPVSVHPDYQNRGIGSKLILEGLSIAKELGFSSVNLLGHPDYYLRFGFKNAGYFNITLPFEFPDGAFMCIELKKDALKEVSGTVQYAKEFNL